jgi:hypothetical protein
MYTQIWNKYLPVIRILMKRAASGEQQLNLNLSDFERSGATRKSGYKFNILFCNGRVDNVISAWPIAKDLAATLLQDAAAMELLSGNDYQVSMTAKFQLGIKLMARTPLAGEAVPAAQPEEAGAPVAA